MATRGINLMGVGLDVGVGVVDVYLEDSDAKHPERADVFSKWANLGRIVMVGGGYALALFGPAKYAGLAQHVASAATPLAVKTVKAALMTSTPAPAMRQTAYAPRNYAPAPNRVAPQNWVPTGGGGYRPTT